MIDRMLQPMGYCILQAANGTEALTICEQRNGTIHLMVTDVTMPGMNGVDLAAYANERWPTIKILFITGLATDAAIRPRTSNHPLLPKPFTRDQLTGEVQELLNRSATGF
jgi:two-component system cell cycle sensor histidine kinase/response regulator CckA